jgi:hypothetical protein
MFPCLRENSLNQRELAASFEQAVLVLPSWEVHRAAGSTVQSEGLLRCCCCCFCSSNLAAVPGVPAGQALAVPETPLPKELCSVEGNTEGGRPVVLR